MDKREIEHTVRLICSDYPRRECILNKGSASDSVLTLYAALNKAVDDAIADAYTKCSAYVPHFAEIMIDDIAECRGYPNTAMHVAMSEGAYKKYKRMIKEGIAYRLGLLYGRSDK